MKVIGPRKKSTSLNVARNDESRSEKATKSLVCNKTEKARHLSNKDFLQIKRKSQKSQLPVFYMEHKDSKNKFLFREAVSSHWEWEHQTGDGSITLSDGLRPCDYSFFMKIPGVKEPMRLMSGGQMVASQLNKSMSVNNVLRSTERKFRPGPSAIVNLAGLFHAGVFVPEDKDFAKRLINLIEDSSERKFVLAAGLTFSSMSAADLPLTRAYLELGADPDIGNGAGWLPLTMAMSKDNEEAAKLLLRHGASAIEVDGLQDGSAFDLMELRGGYDSDSSLDKLIMASKKREEGEGDQ